jgi:uncharacterized protein (DUF2141 family)
MITLVKILTVLLVNTVIVTAQNPNSKMMDITVNIENLNSNEGKLLVGLYNTEADFLKNRYKDAVISIKNNKATLVFEDVPVGIYAVSFVHDENNNGKMDTNFMGIPKEDYGCSNNAKGTFGPPKWKDAKFELKDENKLITISL